MRTTPQGVIAQLVKSYESKRISLFTDLLKSDFQFYIPKDYADSLNWGGKNNEAYKAVIDSAFPFLAVNDVYYFWNNQIEIESHQNLFRSENSIVFTDELRIESIAALTECDSTGRSCDTSAYVLLTTPARISITAPEISSAYGTPTYEFDVGPQVFVLERDPFNSKLWVIAKWYELKQ